MPKSYVGLMVRSAALPLAIAVGCAGAEARPRHLHRHQIETPAEGSRDEKARSIAMAEGAENPLVVEAEKYIGARNVTGYGGPWCGAFMGLVAQRTGYEPPQGFRKAREWLKAGRRLAAPQVGAIAVLRSHVGVVAAIADDGRLVLVSGNHTGGRVGYGLYDPHRILGYVSLS